jgi:hypothetical protein
MRDRIRYDIHCEVKDSLSKMASEKVERERESKVMDKLTLGGLTDQEMLEYAMMLSQENHEPAQGDFVDEQDEELMQAMIESMNFAENQGVYDENTGMTNDELYAESSNSNSNSSNNNNSSDDDGIWPTISESMDVGSGSSQAEEEEEMDEELRYILELSKTVK